MASNHLIKSHTNYQNEKAFASILDDGSVVTWGGAGSALHNNDISNDASTNQISDKRFTGNRLPGRSNFFDLSNK